MNRIKGAAKAAMPEDGEALRRWRKALGIPQTELAKRAGIYQATISRIEAGKCNFTEHYRGKIYQAMKDLNAERGQDMKISIQMQLQEITRLLRALNLE